MARALTPEQQAQLNKLQQEALDMEQQSLQNSQEYLDTQRKIKFLLESLLESSEKKLQNAFEEHKVAKKLAELRKDEADAGERAVEQIEKKAALQKALLEVAQEKLATAILNGETGEKELKRVKKLEAHYKKTKELLDGMAEAQEELTKQIGKAGPFAISLGKSIGLAASFQESLLGNVVDTLDGIQHNAKAQKEFTEQISKTFTVQNAFASLFSKVLESTIALTLAFDAATTEFNKQTGAGGEYNDMIMELGASHRDLGLGIAEQSAAMASLHRGFTEFTNLSDDAAKSLTATVAKLEGIGIAAETSTANFQFMTKSMGLSSTQAEAMGEELAVWASGMGISPAQVGEDFQALGSSLAQFGSQATKVFKGLSEQAKATGIEIGKLVSIAEKLDTFEDAAMAAGKLNAMLGGPLINSVQLVNASFEEKTRILKDAFTQSGKNWEMMSRQERKMIAQAAGIDDMADATAFFTGKLTAEQKAQKELNEMLTKAIPIMKKLQLAAASFGVIFGGVIDTISDGLTTIQAFLTENEKWVEVIRLTVLGLGALWVAMKAWKTIMLVAKGVTIGFALVTKGLAAAQTAAAATAPAAAGGLTIISLAGQTAWPIILAMGGALLLMGLGIAAAALGMAVLASQMKDMGLEAFALVAMLGLLAFAFKGITIALLGMTAGAPGLVVLEAVAIAALMIGAAVGIAAAGIGLMAAGFGVLFKSVSGVSGALVATLGAMFGIIALFLPFTVAAVTVAGAFGAIAIGIGAMAAALFLVNETKLVALGNLGKGLAEMSADKGISINYAMKGFENAIKAAKNIDADVLLNMTKFVDVVSKPVATPGGTTAGAAASTVVKRAQQTAAPSQQMGTKEVVLELNDREFARAVINIVDERLNLRIPGPWAG